MDAQAVMDCIHYIIPNGDRNTFEVPVMIKLSNSIRLPPSHLSIR